MDARRDLGKSGEDLAAEHLRRCGFSVVERNYRCRFGEIDIVARRGRELVFCEVKARRSDRYGIPAEAVNLQKQRRLRRLAAAWLAERSPGGVQIRFDVVSVIVRDGRAELTHLPGAF